MSSVPPIRTNRGGISKSFTFPDAKVYKTLDIPKNIFSASLAEPNNLE